MTEEERSKREERARTENLVAKKTADGYLVYPPAAPDHSYKVGGTSEEPWCSCMDFQSHEHDPSWRCKHIIAAFDLGRSSGENDDAPVARKPGRPKKQETTRTAQQVAHNGESTASQLLLRRSVSPDGKIDSLSVEMSLPVKERSKSAVEEEAADIMDVQQVIVARFLNGKPDAPAPEKRQTRSHPAPEKPPVSAPSDTIPAQLVEIGGRDGKWGRRLFIAVRTSEKTYWLFGSRNQLAEAVNAAGFSFTADDVAEGTKLDLPCRIITKPSVDGRYVNIDRVLPVEGPVRVREARP